MPATLVVLLAIIVYGFTSGQNLNENSHLDAGLRVVIFILGGLAIIGVTSVVGVVVYRMMSRRQRARDTAALQAHGVDEMSGKEFEVFLKHLLTARGFKVKGMWHGNDGGVDLLAKIGSKTYSIQAKRYNNRYKANRSAITDAVAGTKLHKCENAMAITNSHFTKAAIAYAKETGCELVDRERLARWIRELEPNQ